MQLPIAILIVATLSSNSSPANSPFFPDNVWERSRECLTQHHICLWRHPPTTPLLPQHRNKGNSLMAVASTSNISPQSRSYIANLPAATCGSPGCASIGGFPGCGSITQEKKTLGAHRTHRRGKTTSNAVREK